MDFLAPSTWAEALAAKAERPDALPVAGGTDVMVEMNFDHRRPGALLDLTRVTPLGEWAFDDGRVRLGAGVTYARIIAELGSTLPGLAMAARTVGSPQIRNRGTVGGNLGAASPAGDSHPALLAADAVVEIESAARGVRHVPVADFYTGVKRNALEQDELIAAVLIAPPAGPQQFCKIGTRNAMVIAVSAFGFALHPDRRTVGTGIGSAAPTPRRATDAAAFLAGELEAAGLWESRAALPEGLAAEFGRKVRDAAAPIDDVRGTAAYRLHTLSVMARRAATWAWDEHRRAA
ncbi:MAG: FAD binding domain-containing protein [Pseudonocardia sp.]|uniref:FAD binding domain-containing protein n=1 Tax=unclassified Pseudonocardia TaxID=2619320 RepID=UPI000868F88E|nr:MULTISPECIES: FAD binding domain-containing protein [unclassified Pseudonocardia]MBN9110038.1 FAD binding domain-containing protein [Pseudonocardia sp.]ODV07167.1 MAG: carbon monoxide dehydrogenase [Pseudonocardia sp. SCN 73-27]